MITASPLSSLLPLEGVEKDRGKTRVRYTFSTPLWKSHHPRNDVDYHIVKQGDAHTRAQALSIKNKTSPHRSRIFTLKFTATETFFNDHPVTVTTRGFSPFFRGEFNGKIACIRQGSIISRSVSKKKDKRNDPKWFLGRGIPFECT